MRSALGVAGASRPACACLLFSVCRAAAVNRTGWLHGHAADSPSDASGLREPYKLKIYVKETCSYASETARHTSALVTPNFCKELGASLPYDGTGKPIYPGRDFPALRSLSYTGLWSSSEHSIMRYFMVRLYCGQDLESVDTPEDADLCLPSCDDSCGYADWVPGDGGRTAATGTCTHQFPFEVPAGKEEAWGGCEHIGLFSEVKGEDPCQVAIPYYHAVTGLRDALEENASLPRENLMIFAGHSCRGPACGTEAFLRSQATMGWDSRGRLLAEMAEYAESIDPENTRNIFVKLSKKATDPDADTIGANVDFLSAAWEGYARSNFSFQPQGDTLTRRAFYDAWLFGAIPVVTNMSAAIYQRLFLGLVFEEVPFEDIFVVVPDDASGQEVLDMLLSFDEDEIERRRAHLMGLRHYIMWDWNRDRCEENVSESETPLFCRVGVEEYDALMMGLGTMNKHLRRHLKKQAAAGSVLDRVQKRRERQHLKKEAIAGSEKDRTRERRERRLRRRRRRSESE